LTLGSLEKMSTEELERRHLKLKELYKTFNSPSRLKALQETERLLHDRHDEKD
jgi:uncharacterized protein Smg (DUF494 family)